MGSMKGPGPGEHSKWGCFILVGLLLSVFLILMLAVAVVAFKFNPFAQVQGGPNPNGPGVPGGPGTGNQAPVISPRTMSAGSAQSTVTGSFRMDPSLPLQFVDGSSDGTTTDIRIGAEESPPATAGRRPEIHGALHNPPR